MNKILIDNIIFFFFGHYCYKSKKLGLCLVTVFVFYFQKLVFVFGNIMKKQFSCIFEIKNMFGKLKLKI